MTLDTRRTTELVYARNMWRDYDEEYQQIDIVMECEYTKYKWCDKIWRKYD